MDFKAAVVGTGFIGPVHIEALRRAGVEVVGVLGSSSTKSEQAATRWRIPRAYTSLEELLDDSSVDSVHIASPNVRHFDQAMQCLEAGKHVMCEKPLAMNSNESAQLVEKAQATGLAAGVNYNIRYYPLCLEAAERRKQGQFGNIYHVTGSYVQDWLLRKSDFNWRVLADEAGPLRAVADIGTHWLDLVHAITGLEVEAVCADLQTVHRERTRPVGGVETFSGQQERAANASQETVTIDTEDAGSVLIRFAGGARGMLHVSQVTAGRKNCLRWELAGSLQALSWNSESPNELWVGQRETPNQLMVRDPALLQGRAADLASYPGGHNEGFPDTFKQLFIDFYQAIASKSYRAEPEYPTFQDGHREVLLCEAILKSARQQAWVNLV